MNKTPLLSLLTLTAYAKETLNIQLSQTQEIQMIGTLWLEYDKGYRTSKANPGAKFMAEMRKGVRDLHLMMPLKN